MRLLALLAALVFSGAALASNPIVDAVHQLDPKATITSIQKSPIPGLSLVDLDDLTILVSNDGKYVVQGELYDIRHQRDLSDDIRSAHRAKQLRSIPEADRIIFKAPHQVADLVVFLDTDCPFCRGMVSRLSDYTNAGITLEFLAFPRAGVNTDAYKHAITVWCSADRNSALIQMMTQGHVPLPPACPDIVKAQLDLATAMHIPGTPSLLDKDGHALGGFLSPQEILKRLQQIQMRNSPDKAT